MIFIKTFQVVGEIFIKLVTSEVVGFFIFFLNDFLERQFYLLIVSLVDSMYVILENPLTKKPIISEVTILISISTTTWNILIKITDEGSKSEPKRLIKVKAPIARPLRKCHSIFCINRSKCDTESRIAAIILMYILNKFNLFFQFFFYELCFIFT